MNTYLHPFILLFANGLLKDDVGVAKGVVLPEIRQEAGFKTGDFVKKKLGGPPKKTTQVPPLS